MKSGTIYKFVNAVVMLILAFLFLQSVRLAGGAFADCSLQDQALLFATIVIVYAIKFFRLYFILYGKDVPLRTHARQFCKTVPVSVLLPFKSGDLFRMFCYGHSMESGLDGIMVVLADRFIDTLALVSVTLLCLVPKMGLVFSSFYYVLTVFLLCCVLVYLIFPGLCQYWKRILLGTAATPRRLFALQLLGQLEHVYTELVSVVKGRFLVAYVLSLVAWGAEVGRLLLLSVLHGLQGSVWLTVSEYFASAMFGTESLYLRQFIIVSVLLMALLYIMQAVYGKYSQWRRRQ